MISHNGEINTLRGNINWMRAREALFESELIPDIQRIIPIIDEKGSDTACFDNALELLTMAGRPIHQAVMMMIPEPWDGHESMSQEKKDFYDYHACLMEPWDGPASIAFTDGRTIGAVLDRNGLRPSRYYVTKDDYVIMASEVGVLPIAPENVLHKGRLQPGRMFLVNLDEGRIIDDDELKHEMATAKPYGEWLRENMKTLDDLPDAEPAPRLLGDDLLEQQMAFGYYARGPEVHPRPDGAQRRRGRRLDGHGHAAGRALRQAAAALQLLQAALRAGHEPAAGRDPRGARDLGQDRDRPGRQPAGPASPRTRA